MSLTNATILDKNYKKLILQVSLTEVSFCIFDSLKNKIEQIAHFSIDNTSNSISIEEYLATVIKNNVALQTTFDDILVLHNNNLLTFVPSVLYDQQYLSSYMQYNTKVFESDYFTHDEISSYDMNTVYIPYININNFLIDQFGSFKYQHSFTILIKKILDFSKNIEETQVYIHIQKDNFQLIVVKNQKLLLFNTFEFKTDQDFMYYVLFAMEQLQLNPESVLVKLFGTISKEHSLYQIAYKYIRNVSLFTENYPAETTLSEQDYLQHFILIHTCE